MISLKHCHFEDILTSRLDNISSTLFGRTAPLTPLVTILTGAGGKSGAVRRIGVSSTEDEGESCFCLLLLLV
jgi:hypothetical protein